MNDHTTLDKLAKLTIFLLPLALMLFMTLVVMTYLYFSEQRYVVKTCADFTHEEAQVELLSGRKSLDWNKDGIACNKNN